MKRHPGDGLRLTARQCWSCSPGGPVQHHAETIGADDCVGGIRRNFRRWGLRSRRSRPGGRTSGDRDATWPACDRWHRRLTRSWPLSTPSSARPTGFTIELLSSSHVADYFVASRMKSAKGKSEQHRFAVSSRRPTGQLGQRGADRTGSCRATCSGILPDRLGVLGCTLERQQALFGQLRTTGGHGELADIVLMVSPTRLRGDDALS